MINAWALKRMNDRDYLFVKDGEVTKPNGNYWLAADVHDTATTAREAMFLVRFYKMNCIVRYIDGIYYICSYSSCDTYQEAKKTLRFSW